MPRVFMPKKDVYGGDTRRGGAIIHRSDGFRMGKPTQFYWVAYHKESRKALIVICGVPPELKHLSRVRKINQTRFRK